MLETNTRFGICVDARMLGFSGIGVVIENVLSRMIRMSPSTRFHVLINSRSKHNYSWLESENVHMSMWDTPIYSIKQQIKPIPPSPFPTNATWSPHYDVSHQLTGPLLVTVHDVLHLDSSIMKRSVTQKAYAHLMIRYAKWRAARIIFDSKFTQSQFDRFIGLHNSDSRVIWLGVDPKWFDVEWKPKSGSDQYVVFVGNAMIHKNLKILIRSIIEYGTVRLVIIGNSTGLKTLDQESVALAKQHPDLIEVTGRIDDQKLAEIMSGASILVSPSFYEGFGLTPLEAMAVGAPVALSDIPVHREIYDGQANFFNPSSVPELIHAIESSLKTPVGDTLSRKDFARRFNWDDVAKKYLDALLELANKKANND